VTSPMEPFTFAANPVNPARPPKKRWKLGIFAALVISLIAGLSLWLTVGRPTAPAADWEPFYSAVFDLSAEPVAHYTGSGSGASWDLDVTNNGEQIGTVTTDGETIHVLSVGGKLYIKSPADLLADLSSGSSSDSPDSLQGKWITGDDSLTSGLPQGLQSPRTIADQLWTALSGHVEFPKIGAATTTIAGAPALSLVLPGETLYVTANAPYRVLRLTPTVASTAAVSSGLQLSDISGPRNGMAKLAGTTDAASDSLGGLGAADFQPMTQATDNQAFNNLIGQTKTLNSAVDVGVQFDFNQTGNLSCSDSECTVTENVTTSTTSAKPATLAGTVSANMNATVTVNGQGAGGCAQTASLPINGNSTMTCVDGEVSGPVQEIKNQAQQQADEEAAADPGQEVTVPVSLDFEAEVEIEAMADVQAQVDQEVQTEQGEQNAADQTPPDDAAKTPEATNSGCDDAAAILRLSFDDAADAATSSDACDVAPDPAAAVQNLRQNGAKNGPISAKDNIAAAAVNIEGRAPQMLTSVSGQSPRAGTVPEVGTPGNPQRFIPTATGSNTRISDSEYKILNYLANQLGRSSPDVRGSVWIHSELPVCSSCNSIIRQFEAAFPNVDVLPPTVGTPGS